MKLYPHQQEALDKTEGKNRVAYYHDMGLGKTFTGAEKMVQLGARVNLIICQKSKVVDWLDHVFKHYSHKCLVLDLTNKKRFDDYFHYINTPNHIVGVINYELAWRRPELLKLRDFTLMLDESSLIQNKTAKQSRFILYLQPRNVILLSGTPCSGKYENLWTQAQLLGWEIDENTFLRHYVERELAQTYVLGKVRRFWKVLGYKNVDRLKEKLREHGALFLKTEDVMDLPAQTFIDVYVDPPAAYKKFMKNGIVVVDGTELVGDTRLTKRLRARQICSIYSQAKYEAFRGLLESTHDRLIVFYNFTDELKKLLQLVSEMGRKISIVNGQVKDLAAYEAEDDSVTFVQYQAGSKGLNLQKANKIIYFSLTEKCDDWMQSQKRIHRIGQERSCFYYIMKCRRTVEERVHAALKQGKDYTDELFREEEMQYGR